MSFEPQKMILCGAYAKYLRDSLFKVSMAENQDKFEDNQKCEWCRVKYEPSLLRLYEVKGRVSR